MTKKLYTFMLILSLTQCNLYAAESRKRQAISPTDYLAKRGRPDSNLEFNMARIIPPFIKEALKEEFEATIPFLQPNRFHVFNSKIDNSQLNKGGLISFPIDPIRNDQECKEIETHLVAHNRLGGEYKIAIPKEGPQHVPYPEPFSRKELATLASLPQPKKDHLLIPVTQFTKEKNPLYKKPLVPQTALEDSIQEASSPENKLMESYLEIQNSRMNHSEALAVFLKEAKSLNIPVKSIRLKGKTFENPLDHDSK